MQQYLDLPAHVMRQGADRSDRALSVLGRHVSGLIELSQGKGPGEARNTMFSRCILI
jgi:hypothetical protein